MTVMSTATARRQALATRPEKDRANGINPKWVECHRNLGRRPEAWEFLIWNTARIRDFEADPKTPEMEAHSRRKVELQAKRDGVRLSPFSIAGMFWLEDRLTEDGHKAYDQWLKDNAGRPGWDQT